MIDIDDRNVFYLSPKGPVDISMYSRALFIKKAKHLKCKHPPHCQSWGRENANLRGNKWASWRICVRTLCSFRLLLVQVLFYYPSQGQSNVCCTAWQEDEDKIVTTCSITENIVHLYLYFSHLILDLPG